jgi:methionine sulfoxide reductase heme-binding subunit
LDFAAPAVRDKLVQPRAKRRNGVPQVQLIWPWQDRQRRFSLLKAGVFALMFVPALRLLVQFIAGEFGFYPMAVGGLIFWSGIWATAVLLLALAVTPAQRIFRWGSLIDVRRMIGVAGLVYTVLHLLFYFPLRLWNFSFIGNEMLIRPTLVAATVSTIGLIALGATSLDAAIRRMGGRNWQHLHNTVYLISLLAFIHILARGTAPEQFLLGGMFFWLMAWRVLDRYKQGADPRALALLAVASSAFTVLLEAVLTWSHRGYPLSETLGNNFNLDLGIAAGWQILALGLTIALAAAARQALRATGRTLSLRKAG